MRDRFSSSMIMVAVAAAFLITSGAVHYINRENVQTARPKAGDQASAAVARATRSSANHPLPIAESGRWA